MVLVDVIIAERVNKLANLQFSDVRDQVRQQCIRTDVERHTEKCIGRALVELAMKHSSVFDFELKQRVTRRKIDVVGLTRIPTSDNQSSRIGVRSNLFQQDSRSGPHHSFPDNFRQTTATDNHRLDQDRQPVVQTSPCVLRRPTRPRCLLRAREDLFRSCRPTETRTTLPRPNERELASWLRSESPCADRILFENRNARWYRHRCDRGARFHSPKSI